MKQLPAVIAIFALVAPDARGESSDARAARQWLGGVRYGNFASGVSGAGIEFGKIDGAEMIYGLVAMNGTVDLRDTIKDDEVAELTRYSATATIAAAQVRYFFGNSFYLAGALGARRIGFEMDIKDRAGTGSASSKASATSTIARLDVGNLWTWESGFSLGADWIGYSAPITNSYSGSVETDGTATDAINELSDIVEGAAKDLGRVGSHQFLVLNAGYAF